MCLKKGEKVLDFFPRIFVWCVVNLLPDILSGNVIEIGLLQKLFPVEEVAAEGEHEEGRRRAHHEINTGSIYLENRKN